MRGEEEGGGKAHPKKADGGGHSKATVDVVSGRAWNTDDYAVRSDPVSEVVTYLDGGVPTVDAFASETNKRFEKFWSVQDDAFDKDWRVEKLLWINPPFDKSGLWSKRSSRRKRRPYW